MRNTFCVTHYVLLNKNINPVLMNTSIILLGKFEMVIGHNVSTIADILPINNQASSHLSTE